MREARGRQRRRRARWTAKVMVLAGCPPHGRCLVEGKEREEEV